MCLSSKGNVFGLDETLRPDLDDMDERLDEPGILDGVRDTGGRVTLAIYECKKPVIVGINGAAIGIADSSSAVSIALTRQMFYRNSACDHPVEAHKIDSLAMFYTSVAEGREGVQAVQEKRNAKFSASAASDMPPFYPW